MSAPKKIWAKEVGGSRWITGNIDIKLHGYELYHHDDAVRELVEVLEGALNHSFIGLNSEYTRRARAALAKIAQEGR